MIYKETYINVIDNSGVKRFRCIKVYRSFNSYKSYVGNVVLGSLKSIDSKRKKIKRDTLYKGLIVRSRSGVVRFGHQRISTYYNGLVLLNANLTPVGTRIFGPLFNELRLTEFSRLISLAKGSF